MSSWQLLDATSIWIKEFSSALAKRVSVTAWVPEMSWTGALQNWEREEKLQDPSVELVYYPLQRGYHRFPISVASGFGPRQARRLQRRSGDSSTPLVCTTPYYAPVAERWPGPVIYYQTDLTVEYAGVDKKQVRALDRRLCRTAVAVCPNSRRIAEYMIADAGCDPDKIAVVPNATRECNVFDRMPDGPGALPADIADLPRPILGVIGNLAANMDWAFLGGAVENTRNYSWVFVGPTTMDVPDAEQRQARFELMSRGGNVRFVGSRLYGELRDYARSFDAAVLPYRRHEPTFSGSSTRFYEHLAACRPMIATRGFEELLHKEPLLHLTDTPEEFAAAVEDLWSCDFEDGYKDARWMASQSGTWEARAEAVIHALAERSAVMRAGLPT